MRYIELNEVIAIHDEVISDIGGLSGHNKQIGLLESALEHVKNDDYYSSLTDKIIHLMFHVFNFTLF
ncbi:MULTISPECIES: hypothetical protein [unclassified Campylobacter]|uniref:hypothetical protein n=1 Tax=unclassified Campylobacter TaxID=2593542 RepID=UPI001CC1E06D|nr:MULTISPECIES: hypothetical protein [unclassified Campylobacter]